MILNKHGHKRTANELAKEIVLELGANAYYYLTEYPAIYVDKATEREEQAVLAAINKQLDRVAKLLGNPNARRDD